MGVAYSVGGLAISCSARHRIGALDSSSAIKPMSTTAALSHSSPAWSYSPLSLSSLSPDNQRVPGSPQNSPLHSTCIAGLRPSPILFNASGSSQVLDARVPEVASSLLRRVLDGNSIYFKFTLYFIFG